DGAVRPAGGDRRRGGVSGQRRRVVHHRLDVRRGWRHHRRLCDAAVIRPIVGGTAYVEPAKWGVWDVRAVLVPENYVRMVHEAGGRAVVLPPLDEDSKELVRRLDALVLAGGADIEPARYGALAHPRTVARPDRDGGELAVLASAIDADLPVLGVCRGMELLT